MKINFLKSLVLRNKARLGLALFALVFSIWFALTPGAAQSKNQKRITSLHVGEASEGSRVTVVSDAVMNDYEAFRRGDRFYVRIPLADFGAGQPGFRGEGFEDVRVQKVGDSVVISFKLQPGATARVDQRSNRLDVIFSAPNRTALSNRPNAAANRPYVPTDGIVRIDSSQTVRRPTRDAAGPLPPGSPGWPQISRDRVVSERVRESQPSRNQAATTNPRDEASSRRNSRPAVNSGSSRFERPSKTPKSDTSSSTIKSETLSNVSKSGPPSNVSRYEPSRSATPSTSPSYPALATTTPATPGASQSALKAPAVNGSQNGKSRSDIALQWLKANRQAALLGGLLLVILLMFLALLIRRRKNVKTKRSQTTLSQPKSSAEVANSSAVETPVSSPVPSKAPREVVNETAGRAEASKPSPVAVPITAASGPQTNRIQEKTPERERFIPEPAMARSAAVATRPNHAGVAKSSPIDSSTDEDQEREVFEL